VTPQIDRLWPDPAEHLSDDDLVATLDHELVLMREAKIGDHGRYLEETLAAFAQPLQRTEFDLRFAGLRDVRIRRIERAIGKHAGRVSKQRKRKPEARGPHRRFCSVPYHASEPLMRNRRCKPSCCTR